MCPLPYSSVYTRMYPIKQRFPAFFFLLQITNEEQQVLLTGCKEAFGELPSIHGLAVMGSSPAGVGKETLVDVSNANQYGWRWRACPPSPPPARP